MYLLSAGASGLAMAMLELFQPILVVVLGTIATTLIAISWHGIPRRPTQMSPLWGNLALVAILVLTIINLPYASEEIWTGRDGGTYTLSAIRVAETGAILVAPRDDPALPGGAPVTGPGFALNDDGEIVPQFLHLLPVLGATAYGLFGLEGLLAFNVFIGALALLVLFCVAERRVGGALALLVILGLGMSLPFTYFMRARYSEIIFMLFLFGAIYVWDQVHSLADNRAGSFMVGLLCGAAVLARIDGLLLLLPLGFAIGWYTNEVLGLNRHMLIRGFTILTLLAVVDLSLFSPYYLSLQAREVSLICGVSVLFAILGRIAGMKNEYIVTFVSGHSKQLTYSAVILVVCVVVGVSIRAVCCPSFAETPNSWVATAQLNEGGDVVPNRTYEESAPFWLGWYLGWPVVFLAVVGLLGLLIGTMEGAFAWTPVIALVTPFLAYLVRPSITPDHIWASRRMVPVLFPVVLLLSALGFETLRTATNIRKLKVIALPILLCGSLMTIPVFSVKEWAGVSHVTEWICREVGGRPTIVVDAEGGLARQQLLIPLATICGVPTVFQTLDEAASGSRGSDVVVVTLQESVVEALKLIEVAVIHRDIPMMERTVTRVPSRRTDYPVSVFVGRY